MSDITRSRLQALRGSFFDDEFDSQSQRRLTRPQWLPPGNQMVVFVSSTFTDTHHERNIILGPLLAELQALTRPLQIEVVFSDLRSGIPDENTLDHNTWVGCERELKRCHGQSAAVFFLSLQGNKYGYMPLPKTIEKEAFEKRLGEQQNPELSPRSTQLCRLAQQWYILDTNALPPVYVLKRLTGERDADNIYWSEALPALVDFFKGVVFNPSFLDGIIGRSVTEYEVKLALSLCEGVEGSLQRGVRWMNREFEGGVKRDQDTRMLLFDAHEPSTNLKLSNLKAWMTGALMSVSDGSVLMHSFPISVDSFNAQDDAFRTYLASFETHARSVLVGALQEVIATRENWHVDGCGLGWTGEVLDEAFHHLRWAHTKCSSFVGREPLIEQVMAIINGDVSSDANVPTPAPSVEDLEGPPCPSEGHIMRVATRDNCKYYDSFGCDSCGSGGSEARWHCAQCGCDVCFDCVELDWQGGLAESESSAQSSISCALIGRSGTGKTALLAKIASRVAAKEALVADEANRRPVIIRFCGTSKGSANGLSLVQSLCYQIQLIVGDEKKVVPNDYKDAVTLLHLLLSQNAVLLFIDSIDQLSDQDLARSKISFLSGLKPHPNTRIVVSALPDDDLTLTPTNPNIKLYYYGCESYLKANGVPLVVVSNFSSDANASDPLGEARLILESHFTRINRTLTEEQWLIVMDRVAAEPTALYLSLVVYVTSNWRSFDIDVLLVSTVSAISEQILSSLERDYGKLLTRCALGLITWAINGISDGEMEDLLSSDDAVLNQVLKYCPGVDRIPTHVWLRLRSALEGLLVETSNGCYRWYHRQLGEAATTRYGGADERRHVEGLLGRYFANVVDRAVQDKRRIRSQPVTITSLSLSSRNVNLSTNASLPSITKNATVGGDVWSNAAVVNQRRAVESGVHLLNAGLLEEATQELCNLETSCARFKCGQGFETTVLLSRLRDELQKRGDVDTAQFTRVDHYLKWTMFNASKLAIRPELIFSSALEEPMASTVRAEAEHLFVPLPNSFVAADGPQQMVVSCKLLGGKSDFDARVNNLEGHPPQGFETVLQISWRFDDKMLVSCADNDSVARIFNVDTGLAVSTLEGHSATIQSIDWSRDGKLIASGSDDGSVKVWDASTSTLSMTLNGHRGSVTSTAWSRNGTTLYSGGIDGALYFWDIVTGEGIAVETDNAIGKRCLSVHPDDTQILVGYQGLSAAIWDTASRTLLFSIDISQFARYYGARVYGVCWSPDGKQFATADSDCMVVLWDMHTGGSEPTPSPTQLQPAFEQYKTGQRVSWSPSGAMISTSADDGSVRIFDLTAGASQLCFFTALNHVVYTSWSYDGSMLASADKTVGIYNVRNIRDYKPVTKYPDGSVDCVIWSPDGSSIACGSSDHTVGIWDAISGELKRKLFHEGSFGKDENILAVRFNQDGSKLASAGSNSDRTVRIWDLSDGNLIAKHSAHDDNGPYSSVCSVQWSRDGSKVMSSAMDYGILIFDVANNAIVAACKHSDDYFSIWSPHFCTNAVWSPDESKVASSSVDKTVKIWDGKSLALLHTLSDHATPVQYAAWSPDGLLLATCSDDLDIIIWDTSSFAVIRKLLNGHLQQGLGCIDFRGDGLQLLSTSYSEICVWDVHSGVPLYRLPHAVHISRAFWSPDGSAIVVSSEDCTARVWMIGTVSN